MPILGAQLIGFPAGRQQRAPPRRFSTVAAVRSAMQAQAAKLADAKPPAGVDPEMRKRIEAAVRLSFVHAFRVDALAAASLAALAAAGGWLVEKKKRA